jgi:glycosyltransferase involved in cell wall biosynthesis
MKLLIAMPTSGYIQPETYESLWRMKIPDIIDSHELYISKGYGVARARNLIAIKARDEGFDYVFTVDDDMVFPPNTLYGLFDVAGHGAGLASAWAMQRDGTTNICEFVEAENRFRCMDPNEFPSIKSLPDADNVVKVDAIGLACTLISTDVYKRLLFPYHVWHEYLNETFIGEDLYFCDKLRREAPDVEIKVNLALRAGHIKQILI